MYRFIFIVLIFILGACDSASPDSPEAQVRALIEEAELASESRDKSSLIELLSDNFTDKRNHNKLAIGRLLQGYFFRNRDINIFTRVKDIDFIRPQFAKVSLLVAMTGQPISNVDQLLAIKADLHHFELEILQEDDGQWRVLHAKWNRTGISAFQ